MKKTNKLIVLITMLSAITLPSFALEETANQPEIKNSNKPIKIETDYKGLGISGGAISGVGFSYRQFFSEKYGFKTSAVIYFDDNQTIFDIGIQGMREFSSNDWLRFYAIGGLSDFSFKRTSIIYPAIPAPVETKAPVTNTTSPDTQASPTPVTKTLGETVRETVSDTYLNFGAGIGIEIGRKEQGLSLALELPLVVSIKNFNKLNFIYPIPQISLIYNF